MTTPFLLSHQGQDTKACLDFLNNPLSTQDIKQDLLVGGINDLSKIDQYVNVVLRTREELIELISSIGNIEIKKRVGLIK